MLDERDWWGGPVVCRGRLIATVHRRSGGGARRAGRRNAGIEATGGGRVAATGLEPAAGTCVLRGC